jgi:hypothetical protein
MLVLMVGTSTSLQMMAELADHGNLEILEPCPTRSLLLR